MVLDDRSMKFDVGNGGSGVSYPKTLLAAANGITGVDTVIPGHSPVMTWADAVDMQSSNTVTLAANKLAVLNLMDLSP